MAKIRVEELAAQMGVGTKEVIFLLQSIGVDVKSPQAALDDSTVLAILQGKTHAPKQLIVRDAESKAFRPQKSALSRIKIVEKTAAPASASPEPEPEPVTVSAPARPAPAPVAAAAAPEPKARPAEPARTAVVEPEAEPVAPPKPPLPRKIVLPPPRPPAGRPMAPPGMARAGAPRPTGPARPMGPAAGVSRPMGPASGPSGRPGPSVYRPTPGGPGMRPAGMPPRPGGNIGSTRLIEPVASTSAS